MRRAAILALILAACDSKPSHIPTVVRGEKFDEASLVEKGKITVLDFSADW